MPEAVWTYLKGVAMGLGDSVPGVSGGTIAVITNIYDRLIYAIRNIDLQGCRLVLSGRLADAWRHIDGSFLLLLALGMFSGLIVSANTVLYLLDNQFTLLMAFFIGLVLASCWLLRDQYRARAWQNLAAMVAGALLVMAVAELRPLQQIDSLPYLFISGMIAISAMLLPGLSGAFILLLLGSYEAMLRALLAFDLLVLAVFMAGCVVGILASSRAIAWLLQHFHQCSYAGITGMLLGSLLVLWPWQIAVEEFIDGSTEPMIVDRILIAPWNYAGRSGEESSWLLSVLLCIGGALLVFGIHALSGDRNRS
ncbi:MAG: DUF368 domain-containing protein [Gammaproteobacteria bacterium]